MPRKATISLDGMTCSSCSGTISRFCSNLSGVVSINISLATNSAVLIYDANILALDSVVENIEDIGFGAEIMEDEEVKVKSTTTACTNGTDIKGGSTNETSDDPIKTLSFILEGSPVNIDTTNNFDTYDDIEIEIDIDMIVNLISAMPGVVNVKFTGKSSPSINDSTDADSKVQSQAVPTSDLADLESGAPKKNTNANTALTATSASTFTSVEIMIRNVKKWLNISLCYLTGMELESEITKPPLQITVKLNDNDNICNGTGTRSIINIINKNIPISSSNQTQFKAKVAPQGSFLLAKNMKLKHDKELLSLSRTTTIAMIFTLPLFLISMLLMNHNIMLATKSTFGKNIFHDNIGITVGDFILFILCTPVQFGSGYRFHKKALKTWKTHEVGMDFLVSTGTFAAYFYSIATIIRGIVSGQSKGMEAMYFETSAVLLAVILLGKYLEVYTRGVTASAINTLMNLRTRTACMISPVKGSYWDENMSLSVGDGGDADKIVVEMRSNNKEITATTANINAGTDVDVDVDVDANDSNTLKEDVIIDVSLIQKGDIVRLITGDIIPADCKLINGNIGVDESMLTGESAMVGKRKGMKVYSGTIILEGSGIGIIEQYGDDTMLGKIISTVSILCSLESLVCSSM
jgi:P-type Cu+ transporter